MRLQLLNGFAEGGVGHIQRVRGAVKLPASTTRVKALRAENRSIIRFIRLLEVIIHRGKSVFRLGHFPPRRDDYSAFHTRRGAFASTACLYSNQGNAP